ncbi:MAG: hypothetical protein J6K20_08605 [Thermoguttaceae bacterium]|nr:hypothetical protein [Thermoguttaceae bacterium]
MRRETGAALGVGTGSARNGNGAGIETAPFFIGRRAPVERNAEQAPVVGRKAGRPSPNEPPGKRTPNVEKPT